MTGAALTIALHVADPDLADRVTTLLGEVPGIALVDDDAPADVVMMQARATRAVDAADCADTAADDPDAAVAGPMLGYGRSASAGSAVLTPRERQVVALLAEGLSNKQVALRLGIAPDTAKFHVGRLIDKLAASGRTDAVAQAARRGIVKL